MGKSFLARVEETGPNIVCVHKGFSGGQPVRVAGRHRARGRVRIPTLRFVVYHSGFESAGEEGPYTEATADRGVNRLISALRKAGIAAGRQRVRRARLHVVGAHAEPDPGRARARQAARRPFGPDRILWGTDSLWYGSPQDQIQAFRAFEIAAELQEQYGYPALTPEIKRKILGENAMALYGVDEMPDKCTFTRDELATLRVSMPTPWKTYGPSTDAQLAALLADHGMV